MRLKSNKAKIISTLVIGLAILGVTPVMAESFSNGNLPQPRRPLGEIIDKGLRVSGFGIEYATAWTKSSYGYAKTSVVAQDSIPNAYVTLDTAYSADGWAQVDTRTGMTQVVKYASHYASDDSATTYR